MNTETRRESPTDSSGASFVLANSDYPSIVANLVGYALVVDSQRRIRWMNQAPTGRSPTHYIDHDLLQFIVEDQRPLMADAIDRALAGAPTIELEVQGAEELRWYCARVVKLESRQAAPAVFVHAIDVDDAKRTKTELSIERARRLGTPEGGGEIASFRHFELMIDALPVLISYVDREARYRYNNAAYERWFGTSREVIYGRRVVEVVGEVAFDRIRNYVEAALSGRSVRFEMMVPYQNGGVRRVVAHYIPDLTEHGEVAGFYALIEDVSAQREAEAALREREDQLRQVQKLEALGRLASGVAHEFGNLLMTVVSGCSAISEVVPRDSEVATMIGRVKRAAQRGTSLTRQLLSFGRASELPSGPLEIDPLVGDMVVLLDRLLGSPIELEVDLDANAWIVADPGQIQQLLMNLAINARDAMPEGGRLQVITKLVELEAGPHVLLSVADTGVGMDEATRARIFDPFFTTKAPGQGTGLGLSTVYGIVHQAGGHIEVESSPGLGTSFRLYFPILD